MAVGFVMVSAVCGGCEGNSNSTAVIVGVLGGDADGSDASAGGDGADGCVFMASILQSTAASSARGSCFTSNVVGVVVVVAVVDPATVALLQLLVG